MVVIHLVTIALPIRNQVLVAKVTTVTLANVRVVEAQADALVRMMNILQRFLVWAVNAPIKSVHVVGAPADAIVVKVIYKHINAEDIVRAAVAIVVRV